MPEPGRNSIPFLPQFFHTGNPSSIACVVGACGGWHWNPWIMGPISGFSLAPSRQQKSVFASERAAKEERVGLGCNMDATGKHWRRGLSRSQERLSLQPGISWLCLESTQPLALAFQLFSKCTFLPCVHHLHLASRWPAAVVSARGFNHPSFASYPYVDMGFLGDLHGAS